MRKTMVGLTLLLVSAAYAEDLTITSKVSRDGGAAETVTSYVSSDHMRMVQPEGAEMLVDLNAGSMTVIDTKKKQYWVVTKKDMDEMSARIKEQMDSPEMKQAQEQMKSLPPEMQKRMEAMMGGMMKADVHKTGESRKVAGLHCDMYSVSFGTMSKSEQCLTNEVKLPPQSWERYRAYADSMKTMMSAYGPMAKGLAQMREEMKKLKGFPIYNNTTTTVMGRTSTSTTEVTAIKYGAIPSSAWDIPAGYKQIESPMKSAIARRSSR